MSHKSHSSSRRLVPRFLPSLVPFAVAAMPSLGCVPPEDVDRQLAPEELADMTEVTTQALITTPPSSFTQPFGGLSARAGSYNAVVICMNANASGSAPMANRPEITNYFWGNDGRESVAGWFAQNSNGRFTQGSTAILGCDAPYFQAPMQGDWYWNTGNHGTRWLHAIQAADPHFNFRAHDKNGDNRVTGDELAVIVVFPGASPYGVVRRSAVSAAVDGVTTPLAIDIVDTYLVASGADVGLRKWNVGLLAHEISHAVANTVDMYEAVHSSGALIRSPWPDQFSIMGRHKESPNLDPLHRMKLGWLDPEVIALQPAWISRQSNLRAAASGAAVKLIHDPARGTKEYFLVENRSGADIGTLNYDNWIVRQGPVIWHVIEDLDEAYRRAPVGFDPTNWSLHDRNDWGRTAVRLHSFCGSSDPVGNPNMNMNRPIKLKWADGSHAHMRLTCTGPVGDRQGVLFDNTRPRFASRIMKGTQHGYGLPFKLVDGTFRATMTGTGDADLYIRRGAWPTRDLHDCASLGGRSDESCTLNTPGDYYVMVYGYTDATYELNLDYTGH